ncbi:MAG: hypothetical protein Ct9H300mP11_11470 [Chloroflexota bacterium]|nr:MAG: hypothetical protein Ct9H300mP11_11470 [Chloroflexota bacterium]
MENVALWGERDISHSSAERVVLPDSCLALDYILNIFSHIIEGLRVFPERMFQNIESSFGWYSASASSWDWSTKAWPVKMLIRSFKPMLAAVGKSKRTFGTFFDRPPDD